MEVQRKAKFYIICVARLTTLAQIPSYIKGISYSRGVVFKSHVFLMLGWAGTKILVDSWVTWKATKLETTKLPYSTGITHTHTQARCQAHKLRLSTSSCCNVTIKERPQSHSAHPNDARAFWPCCPFLTLTPTQSHFLLTCFLSPLQSLMLCAPFISWACLSCSVPELVL